MKSRILWLVVVVAALGGFYYATIRPMLTRAPSSLNRQLSKELKPPEFTAPQLPTMTLEMPTLPLPAPEKFRLPQAAASIPRTDDRVPMRMEVPIQNGATIDFSIGAPVVRSQAEDKAAIEKALKEMAEATKNIEFPASEPKK